VNETPAHPARGFTGRAQVRRNWEQIFAFVPDLHADIAATAVAGQDVWTEWDMRGTRRDGSAHHMRGVVVFTVADDVATRARFYLEPVESTSGTVGDAVLQQVVR
jgi:ketosteroid isomerase-like protein